MATPWTEEQRRVIETRNCNLLVSAAAGSGKTAVLVERIVSLLMDDSSPLDIDRLLVVTFTNAAAAEMRERIGQKIEEYVETSPDNEHLQRQATLIHTAAITTIDSFCMRVLREHFDETNLDPSFRIGDEGEQRLLKSEVAEQLLEDYYREGRPEFYDFVESYSTGKTDVGLEELMEKLYEFSMSYPQPEEWLLSALKQYDAVTLQEWNHTEAAQFLMEYMHLLIADDIRSLRAALEICGEPDGPFMYADALESDLEQLEKLKETTEYETFGSCLCTISFVRLSAKKAAEVSAEKREWVKAVRDGVKEDCKTLCRQFYSKPPEILLRDMQAMKEPMQMLITLTLEFLRRYAEKKREKNLIDFHDVEHFALDLLAKKKEDGNWVPTATAAEYREQFAQIMIDEYQDSNLVQEVILTSISGETVGKPNIFMVGDVKQSIYKFRLARPELFMEKYHTYSLMGGAYQRIDLHKNFRSRGEVLSGVNAIFERIMTKQLGKILYDESEALYEGAVFEPKPLMSGWEEADNKTELYLIEKKTEDDSQEFTSAELEAKVIAAQIRKLTGEQGILVWDKEKKKYRRASYRDMVILLRSVGSYADTFLSVFSEEGIPAHAQSQNGYFTAVEVQNILNYLRVTDNPRQDIPLAGVLKSPLGGFTAGELAELRADFPEGGLYDSLLAYGEKKTGCIAEKVQGFLEQLQRMRRMAAYTPIHDLIRTVIRETGYADYILAMPSGQKRKLNLDMLIEKAYRYEATSYRGLFQFLRYIEKLNKYEVDYGEASAAGENENAVRIMSIHKSKGLEFPIVFLAGLGRRLNQQDAAEKIVLHPDMGVGGDVVDYRRRTRSVTLVKRILQKSLRLENLAEELRVLYVAMTRAKEKLIMTGAVTDVEKRKTVWEQQAAAGDMPLSYRCLSGASSYLDWIVPACHSGSRAADEVSAVRILTTSVPEVVEADCDRQKELYQQYQELSDWEEELIYDMELREEIGERFTYQYPYREEVTLHGKVSVSEIKKRSQMPETEENPDSVSLIPEEPPILPEYIQGKAEQGGAARGTLYHRVLEKLDLARTVSREQIEMQLAEMTAQSQLTEEEKQKIHAGKLWKLFHSPLGQRIRQAQKNGTLCREQPFVLGRKAKEFYPGSESEEIVLLQGIIDVYFEEADGLVLLDYKTDFIPPEADGEEILRKRYRTQFLCYGQALEQITGKKVKEMLLYSFALERVIVIT